MNIFASDSDPHLSAIYLDDLRVNKMILESTQMLSTAIKYYGGNGPYRSTHMNHPCSIWTRQNKSNYNWLLEHYRSLCSEFEKRNGKIHKCFQFVHQLTDGLTLIPEGFITPFPNCTTLKTESDVHEAYKKYLEIKWINDKRPPKRYKKMFYVPNRESK